MHTASIGGSVFRGRRFDSSKPCPLWVKSRLFAEFDRCPLYPQKRTFNCSTCHVPFVPKADMAEATTSASSKGLTNAVSGPLHGSRGPVPSQIFPGRTSKTTRPWPALICFPPPSGLRKTATGYATATGRRSIARKPERGRHRISCSGTARASFGQRRNSAFNAHDPSIRAS
jgi:hypothetical protein